MFFDRNNNVKQDSIMSDRIRIMSDRMYLIFLFQVFPLSPRSYRTPVRFKKIPPCRNPFQPMERLGWNQWSRRLQSRQISPSNLDVIARLHRAGLVIPESLVHNVCGVVNPGRVLTCRRVRSLPLSIWDQLGLVRIARRK